MEVIFIDNQLTNEEIEKVKNFLSWAQPLISSNDFQIKPSEKNRNFDIEFSMKHEDKKEILQTLTSDDCVEIRTNTNPRYQDAELYIFLKSVDSFFYGEPQTIDVYIKMYIKQYNYYDKVIVISFHKEGEFD